MVKLVLDPGHGGKDPGAVGNGLLEKDINVDLAKRVAAKLSTRDLEVTLTRFADIDLELSERAGIANKLPADYFCSLHVNAGGGTGFESYIYTNAAGDTQNLRNIVHDKLADYYNNAGFPDRGKKSANFAVLRETDMPAVLLENLFIENSKDAAKLKEPTFLDGLAAAIAAGLSEALAIPEKPPVEGPGKTPVPIPPPSPPPAWDPAAEIAKLKADGLVNSEHQPGDPVVWGELAAVINRLRGK